MYTVIFVGINLDNDEMAILHFGDLELDYLKLIIENKKVHIDGLIYDVGEVYLNAEPRSISIINVKISNSNAEYYKDFLTVEKQNEQKDIKLQEDVNKVESTKTEDTYESLMNQAIERSGLTLDEFTKQNNEFIREALFNNKGLTEEDIAFIEKRLAEENSK